MSGIKLAFDIIDGKLEGPARHVTSEFNSWQRRNGFGPYQAGAVRLKMRPNLVCAGCDECARFDGPYPTGKYDGRRNS
jgi:hypothetical protein